MAKDINIKNILRILMIVLSVTFLLTACSNNETGGTSDTSAVNADEDSAEIAKKQNECWVSNIVTTVYDAMGRASLKLYDKITEGALSMMMIAFAVWLSFRMLDHLSSVKEVNPNEFWTEVMRKLAVCFVCGLLASSKFGLLFVLNTLIFPIYNAFLEFGAAILNAAANEIPPSGMEEWWAADSATPFDRSVICQVTGNASIDLSSPNASFPESPKLMMQCLICAVWNQLNFGYMMAYESMKTAKMMGFLVGLLVIACFTIVKVGFAFYIIDSIFKLAMMAVILPLLIMSFAFKATKGYAEKGFFIMLTSSAFMMFIAIVISMTLMAMNELIGPRDFEAPSDPIEREAYDLLEKYGYNVDKAKEKAQTRGNRRIFWSTLVTDYQLTQDIKKEVNEETRKIIDSIEKQHTAYQDTSGDKYPLRPDKTATSEMSITVLSIMMICFLVVSSIGVAQEVTGSLIGQKVSAKFQEKVKVLGQIILGFVTGGAASLLGKLQAVQKVKKKVDSAKKKVNEWRGKE